MVVRKKEQGGKEEWRKVAKRWQAGWKGGRGGYLGGTKQGGKEGERAGWKGGREQGGKEGEQGKKEEAGWKGERDRART